MGDSALDLLITRHLFESHTDIDPGELTDLRSASVNNESFAKVAVRHDLHEHLEHCSGLLVEQIKDYVKFVTELHGHHAFPSVKCPKVRYLSCTIQYSFDISIVVYLLRFRSFCLGILIFNINFLGSHSIYCYSRLLETL